MVVWMLTTHCLVLFKKTLIRQFSNGEERLQKKQPIRNQDDSKFVQFIYLFFKKNFSDIAPKIFLFILCLVLLKVYCSDHTYSTIRIAVAATGREVVGAVADKLGTTDELLLVHLSSSGGKTVEPQVTATLPHRLLVLS